MKTYEAMFVLNPAMATDWSGAEAEVKRFLDRAGAKVHGIKNWEERKLAYPIGQHKRGLYVLAYFDSEADKIGGLERDVQLSENAIRVLVLRRETMSPDDVAKALAAPPAPKTPVRSSGDEWSQRSGRPGVAPERASEAAVAVPDVPEEIFEEEDR